MHRWWCYNYYVFVYTNNIYTIFVFKNCFSTVLGFTRVVTVGFWLFSHPWFDSRFDAREFERLIKSRDSRVNIRNSVASNDVKFFNMKNHDWSFNVTLFRSWIDSEGKVSNFKYIQWNLVLQVFCFCLWMFTSSSYHLKFDMDFFLYDRQKKDDPFRLLCNVIFKPKFWLFKKIHIDFYIGKIPYNKNSLSLFF